MRKPDKIQAVAELVERIKGSKVAIATQYKGANVEQMTELRRKMRAENIEFKVYKNTLAKRALDELGLSDASPAIEGPTAWAFAQDPLAPAKLLKDFAKEVKAIIMNGGILEGRALTKAQVDALASLPPREILLAQLLGVMVAPMRNLLGVFTAVPRDLVSVLDEVRKKKEAAA